MSAESERVVALAEAQRKATLLFDRIATDLIRPGVSEAQLTREIADLGRREFGIETHWHKRLVRAGSNTSATGSSRSISSTAHAGSARSSKSCSPSTDAALASRRLTGPQRKVHATAIRAT